MEQEEKTIFEGLNEKEKNTVRFAFNRGWRI